MAVLIFLGFVSADYMMLGLTQEPATRLLLDILLRLAFGLMTLWALVKYFDKGSYREIIHTRNMGSALLAGGGIVLLLAVEIVLLFTKTPAGYWSEWREFPWTLIAEEFIGRQLTDAFYTELLFALLLEGYYRQGDRTGKRRLLYGLLCGGVCAASTLLNRSDLLFMGVFGFAMAAVYLHSHTVLVPMLLHFLQSVMGHLMPYETEQIILNLPLRAVLLVAVAGWAVAFLLLPAKSLPQRLGEVAAQRSEGE